VLQKMQQHLLTHGRKNSFSFVSRKIKWHDWVSIHLCRFSVFRNPRFSFWVFLCAVLCGFFSEVAPRDFSPCLGGNRGPTFTQGPLLSAGPSQHLTVRQRLVV
jgi:hypothetical protein